MDGGSRMNLGEFAGSTFLEGLSLVCGAEGERGEWGQKGEGGRYWEEFDIHETKGDIELLVRRRMRRRRGISWPKDGAGLRALLESL